MSTDQVSPIVELSDAQSWALLRVAVVGRLAVIVDGAPDIFPVNHQVDQGSVVFRTAIGTKLAGALGQRVAFEVDGYDPENASAWSVVLKGTAQEVKGLYDMLEAFELQLFPWHTAPKPFFIRIEPDSLSGRRFEVTAVGPEGPTDPSRHAADD